MKKNEVKKGEVRGFLEIASLSFYGFVKWFVLVGSFVSSVIIFYSGGFSLHIGSIFFATMVSYYVIVSILAGIVAGLVIWIFVSTSSRQAERNSILYSCDIAALVTIAMLTIKALVQNVGPLSLVEGETNVKIPIVVLGSALIGWLLAVLVRELRIRTGKLFKLAFFVLTGFLIFIIPYFLYDEAREKNLPPASPDISHLAGDSGKKVLLIGIDGASWDVIDLLIEQHKMPNLQRIKEGGLYARLKTLTPTKSPAIWTSIATGKGPEKHGINDFIDRVIPWVKNSDGSYVTLHAPRYLKTFGWRGIYKMKIPVSSSTRLTLAIWNILSDAGRTVSVVNWWATWPAEPVNGFMVSGRFSQWRWNVRFNVEFTDRGLTYPDDLVDDLKQFVIGPEEIQLSDVQRFLNISDLEELNEDGFVKHDILSEFRYCYSRDIASIGAAMNIIEKNSNFDLFAVYLNGLDVVSHSAMKYSTLVNIVSGTEKERRSFGKTVENYYRFYDEEIGKFAAFADDETIIMIVSDHGFEYEIDENDFDHHNAPDGILIVSGNTMSSGKEIFDAHVLDITPTILALMELPVARDMDGKVLSQVIESNMSGRHQAEMIGSYEYGRGKTHGTIESKVDEEVKERLKALGYLQ